MNVIELLKETLWSVIYPRVFDFERPHFDVSILFIIKYSEQSRVPYNFRRENLFYLLIKQDCNLELDGVLSTTSYDHHRSNPSKCIPLYGFILLLVF